MSRNTPSNIFPSSFLGRGRRRDHIPQSFPITMSPEEIRRLDIQNEILDRMLGGLYPAVDKVNAALAPSGDSIPRILDLGTGSGAWAVDIAEQFPHAEVIGVDLHIPTPSRPIPPNLRFELDDANGPLPHYANSFNLIHARALDARILDYPLFVNQVACMLRPGGVFIVSKCNLQLVDGNTWAPLPNNNEGEPGFTWLQRVLTTARNCITLRGGHEEGPLLWRPLLTNDPHFECFAVRDVYIPIGPWKTEANDQSPYVGSLMRENVSSMLSNLRPLILDEEYPAEIIDRWITEAREELRYLRVKANAIWHYAWVTRREIEWEPLA
ncbi:hypothetical protein FRC03_001216 [Tulasnella sp. 419]|nr:hypothetical protein FRC02_005203 [Tulasnella sp. 418]KAG8964916.1 hypothetical protein FRC03_001216 [Tulasnella sp. 419]